MTDTAEPPALLPADEADLAEAIRSTTGPLRIRGAGTRRIGISAPGRRLATAAMTGVTLYEPGALTLVVRAGTPLAEVEALLAAEGQRLPFEPPDLRRLLDRSGTPTIGGVVAANASGPARVQRGACRDSLIGVRFIDGAGRLVRNGGRVMKNVTGYDLARLMAGSHGTLGVLTEVAFKVLPAPEAQASLILPGLEAPAAVQAMAAALGSPFEVTGAAWLPDRGVLLRIEGFARSVAYRADRLAGLLAPHGAAEIDHDPQRGADLWCDIRDVAAFHGRPGDVWRVSVRPTDAPAVLARAGAGAAVLDWGGGLVWLLLSEGADLRARLGALDGHATLVRASDDTRARLGVFHPEPAPVAALSAGLRARFDPRAILNRGMMHS